MIAASSIQLFRDGGLSGVLQEDLEASPLPPDRPTPGREENQDRLRRATDQPAKPSKAHHFTLKLPGEKLPVTWSPCRPIHYVVRPDNAPPEAASLLTHAFRQLSAATGLVFVHDGTTDEKPSRMRKSLQLDRYGDRWAPVLIAWTAPGEVPELNKDALGSSGPQMFQAAGGKLGFVSGFVYLNAANIAKSMRSLGTPVLHKVLLHELAHVVGLDHVDDQSQVMARRAGTTRLTSYQDGDLTGLNILGAGPCQPKL
jgi:hypothetical protein